MGKRGPKPKGFKGEVLPAPKARRPNPQPGMNQAARTVWLRIVKAYPREHFKNQHLDLLRSYCEASAMHKRCTQLLAKEDMVITQGNMVKKENPLIGIIDKMAGRMQGLSVKLGISVNNTTARTEPGSGSKPKSKRSHLLGGK